MGPIHVTRFFVNDLVVDRYGNLKPSALLFYAQEAAGQHCDLLQVDQQTLAAKRMFWAIIRQRLQITRLPHRGETLRVETWPMPTTRAAYPRSVVAYDEEGNECFRSISLWVLMDLESRSMILPGRSGVTVEGMLTGSELSAPTSLPPGNYGSRQTRNVSYTDLDRNGHMNNTRYLDWIADLLPSRFHREHRVREFTVCYLSEALEGQQLTLHWDFEGEGSLRVDAYRPAADKEERVFSARIYFDSVVM